MARGRIRIEGGSFPFPFPFLSNFQRKDFGGQRKAEEGQRRPSGRETEPFLMLRGRMRRMRKGASSYVWEKALPLKSNS